MSKRYEEKRVKQQVLVGYTCDVCHTDGEDVTPWVNFSSQHCDWGNDSVDSYEAHDVCSWECYLTKVAQILVEWGKYPTLEIDDKPAAFFNQEVFVKEVAV